jgi:hypothetical protein
MYCNKRRFLTSIPDEAAETEYQDTHSDELNDTSQARVEGFHELRKHGCERQRTEALRKGYCCGHRNGSELPFLAPVLYGLSVVGDAMNRQNENGPEDHSGLPMAVGQALECYDP